MSENFAHTATIPQPVYDAVMASSTDELGRAFDYSATVLCKSPRQVQLEKRHPDVAERIQFMDNWYAFLGDAVHNQIERRLKNNENYLVEKRIIRFDKPEGTAEDAYRRVGARFDAYDKRSKTLSDHKTTTTFIHGKEMKPEWFTQLMINAYFLMEEGYEVDWLAVNAIYMDWRDQRVKYSPSGEYPLVPSAEFRLPCPPKEEIKSYYLAQLAKHIAAEGLTDEELPECPADYCWERPAKYAVYRPGAGRAIKLCDSVDECYAYIKAKMLSGVEIEERPATRMRCENYCGVNSICSQYQTWKTRQIVGK